MRTDWARCPLTRRKSRFTPFGNLRWFHSEKCLRCCCSSQQHQHQHQHQSQREFFCSRSPVVVSVVLLSVSRTSFLVFLQLFGWDLLGCVATLFALQIIVMENVQSI